MVKKQQSARVVKGFDGSISNDYVMANETATTSSFFDTFALIKLGIAYEILNKRKGYHYAVINAKGYTINAYTTFDTLKEEYINKKSIKHAKSKGFDIENDGLKLCTYSKQFKKEALLSGLSTGCYLDYRRIKDTDLYMLINYLGMSEQTHVLSLLASNLFAKKVKPKEIIRFIENELPSNLYIRYVKNGKDYNKDDFKRIRKYTHLQDSDLEGIADMILLDGGDKALKKFMSSYNEGGEKAKSKKRR